jgi:hypothetical protein
MDLLIWLGPSALSGIALLVAVLMLGRRVDVLGEYLMDLRRLHFSVQGSQEEVARILEVLAPISSTLPQVADVKLHLCQLKRQQHAIAERLTGLSEALESLQELRPLLEGLKDEQAQSLGKLATISEMLTVWTARLDTANSELTHLFAYESIASLLSEIDPGADEHMTQRAKSLPAVPEIAPRVTTRDPL